MAFVGHDHFVDLRQNYSVGMQLCQDVVDPWSPFFGSFLTKGNDEHNEAKHQDTKQGNNAIK